MAAVEHGIALSRKPATTPTGGSAVVINPWTGGIYALASVPTYNQVAAANDPGYRTASTRQIRSRCSSTVRRRGLPHRLHLQADHRRGRLSRGLITPTTPLLCSGSFTLGNFVFHNVEAGIYESMTLPTALAQSCDTWFYRLGDRIYRDDPADGTAASSSGHTGSASGSAPASISPASRPGSSRRPHGSRRRSTSPWYEGQTINLAIGQGYLAGDAAADGGRVLGARERRHRRATARRGRGRSTGSR